MKLKKFSAAAVFLVFITVIALLTVCLPKARYSENEKRVLSELPSLSSLTSGSFGTDLESYLADHFPFRDLWVGLHAYARQAVGQNGLSGVYAGRDSHLITAAGAWDRDKAVRNMETLRKFAEDSGLPATVMAVPSAGAMLGDKLPANHDGFPDDEILDLVAENAGDLRVIDLRPVLKATENAYYRTDHHLTSAGALAVYQAFSGSEKTYPVTRTVSGFYGTAYSKSGLWLTAPDDLEIREVPGNYRVTVREGTKETVRDSLYFPEHLDAMDKYPVFLDGNHSLVTVENTAGTTGKRLLLIKDSFAHCFATFAAADYDMICMVDLRYYKASVSDLIEAYGLNELLFLYGAENLATSTDIPWLK